METKRSLQNARNDSQENLSVPPGFVSLTSLTFKRTVTGGEASDPVAVAGKSIQGPVDPPLSNSDVEKFKSSLRQRPWILHDQFNCLPQQYGPEQIEVDTKFPVNARLPVGVIRGCASCSNCVKVTDRWHPEESLLPVLDDAPVFRPTEEEFKDTLKYIAKIRPKSENYGMCRIVPPPSWRPPCLLEDKKIREASKFCTHAQRIDELQNMYLKRKLSTLHEKMNTMTPNGADSKEAKSSAVSSAFEPGPELTLKSFKKYAGDFKRQYFCPNDMVIEPDESLIAFQGRREPLLARIEGEYWRIIENPSSEIEVLCGTNLGSQTLGSGFPLKTSQNMAEYSEYVESGWNLINTSKLSGSLLPFGCYDTSSILAPQLFIGMCFASQCWRNEDHHLYSLSYMHLGDPKVCYSVPGRYCFKFLEVVKKLFPQLSKYPKLLHDLLVEHFYITKTDDHSVAELASELTFLHPAIQRKLFQEITQISPSTLKSEGIPVYRCVQNPLEFVLIFPGAFHTEFSCGFNCSESVCFAPFDWLPHGQNIVELYSQYCLKTSISHDRLLLGGAMVAVSAQWESIAIRNESVNNQLRKSVWGKDGLLTKALKSRVRIEDIRREHLCNPSLSRALDELDVATKRECIICLYDLYFSAVGCSCSPDKYSCLRHAKQLCSCPWGTRCFLFRYSISELNLLVEALEGNLRAIHCWAKRKVCLDALLAPMKKQKNHNGISSGIHRHSSHELNIKTSDGGSNEQKSSSREDVVISQSAQNVVILLSDDEEEPP